jgi:hypothetical protein
MLVQICRWHFRHLIPWPKKYWQNFWNTSVDSTTRYRLQWKNKKEGHLPFLDFDIYRKKTDGSLVHKVYWKPTHTNLYLHENSHHHSANKQSVLASLIHAAKAVCDQDSLPTSRTMDTALNRYDEPWNRQQGPPRTVIKHTSTAY